MLRLPIMRAVLWQAIMVTEAQGQEQSVKVQSMRGGCSAFADNAMSTAYPTHPACLLHEMGVNHPECPDRVRVIEQQLIASGLMDSLTKFDPPSASIEELDRVHSLGYIEAIFEKSPAQGLIYLDPDTAMNSDTLDATLFAAGAAVHALEHHGLKRVAIADFDVHHGNGTENSFRH